MANKRLLKEESTRIRELMGLKQLNEFELDNYLEKFKEYGVKFIDDVKDFINDRFDFDDESSKKDDGDEKESEESIIKKIKKGVEKYWSDEKEEDSSKVDTIISPLCRKGLNSALNVTSEFGVRTFRGKQQEHPALDLTADYEKVVAPFDSIMSENSGFGFGDCGGMIILKGVDQEMKPNGMEAKFCHMSEIKEELKGMFVPKGAMVGVSGGSKLKDGVNKRGNSEDPHLHFELKIGGELKNPKLYIKDKSYCPRPKKYD